MMIAVFFILKLKIQRCDFFIIFLMDDDERVSFSILILIHSFIRRLRRSRANSFCERAQKFISKISLHRGSCLPSENESDYL